MTIGQTIKRLRKQQDITQEKLAEHLGISYQAVSKWENDSALPDITLVVPLANFFGVTTDELFSRNDAADEEAIRGYEKRFSELKRLGDMPACITLVRDALALYPRHAAFSEHLANALFSEEMAGGEAHCDEVIALCERILDDCTEDLTRQGAIQLLCFAYSHTDQRDKAIALANTMPVMTLCREMLLEQVLEGDEKIHQLQRNIQDHVEWLHLSIRSLDNPKAPLADRIAVLTAANAVVENLYDDGNLLFFHCRIYMTCPQIARWELERGDPDAAMANLHKAKHHALAADAANARPAPYTARLVNAVTFDPTETSKNWIGTYRETLAEALTRDDFDALRDRDDFRALQAELEEAS